MIVYKYYFSFVITAGESFDWIKIGKKKKRNR